MFESNSKMDNINFVILKHAFNHSKINLKCKHKHLIDLISCDYKVIFNLTKVILNLSKSFPNLH